MDSRAHGKRRAVVIGLALVLLALLQVTGLATRIDQAGLDRLLYLAALGRPLPPAIVLVDIDQKSLEDMNAVAGSWPWPRAVHAELVDVIAAQQPRAIIFDVLFNEADTFRPDSDTLFAEVVAATPSVYLPTMLLSDGDGAPLAVFPPALRLERTAGADDNARAPLLVPLVVPPEAWRGGTINFLADSDGIGRRHALAREVGGWRIPSMAARVADDLGWPRPATDTVLLNWYGAHQHRYSYADVYHDLTGSTPQLADAFRDRIVVIGAAAPGLGDLRPTPMSSTYPGVLVLATALGNLHDGDWLIDTRHGLLLYALLPALLLLAFLRRANLLHLGLALAVASVALVVAQALLISRAHVAVHVFAPLAAGWLLYFALALLSWREERARREQAVTLFGRFLDRRVVDNLVEGGGVAAAQTTQAREISILFSDIRGFTTLSERSTPEQVVTLLNNYFSRQVQVIFATQGTLDKFIGDAIMAFWGAPADDPAHARHAVEAALRMVDELERFKAELGPDGEGFDVGIGVHSGPAVVGFIGSHDRLDYTVIGDSVNLASRIEGATKGKARILVSEATATACGDAFEFIDHGTVHVKGREQGVRLYEPRRKITGSAAAGSGGHDRGG